mgnify:CR=1 FL=1
MAKLSTEDLLDAFKEMTLLELSEFVKMFEETFDVTAAAPVAVAGPAAAAALTFDGAANSATALNIAYYKDAFAFLALSLLFLHLMEERPLRASVQPSDPPVAPPPRYR